MIFFYILFPILFLYLVFLLFVILGVFKNFDSINSTSDDLNSLSVIVPAKNEASTIHETLLALEEQDYSENFYEVQMVSDRSYDKTDDNMKEFASRNKNFYYHRIDEESE